MYEHPVFAPRFYAELAQNEWMHALAFLIAGATLSPTDILLQIYEDASLPHVAAPSGVPNSYDWAARPRVGMGHNPGEFRAMIPWGQVYLPQAGNPALNTRVALRDLRAYWLSKSDRKWRLWVASYEVGGAAYREDFVDDKSKPAQTRVEPDGSISVKLDRGYNYHYWTPDRVPIQHDDIAGVWVTGQARLVVDDPNLPDDRHLARILVGKGADYWLSITAGWDHFRTNGDIAIGRFRWVGRDWGWHHMTTLSLGELRRNPPPLEGLRTLTPRRAAQ